MSVLAPDDLAGLVVSGAAQPPCDGRDNCPREPVYLAYWAAGCTCQPSPCRLCLGCEEFVREHCRQHQCVFCTLCGAPWILLRVEPLPR